ncbi:serine-rich adhesin for platelets isoform X2 [Macrobrachium rosenbergii]|uniref:serine-rich adhesin for platelets isoform X2 n=1 Tax=Macrobrachium rosenbergii TaxID=79674 RepID=UPI0034D51875
MTTASLTDEKEMLSPDVPEFVPREFQNHDASAGAGHVEHTASSYTSHSHSQSHHYSSNHGVFNPGSWRSESVHSLSLNEKTRSLNRYRSGQGENKPFYPSSNSSWRNTGNDGFNPKYSGKLRDVSLKEKQNWRENTSQAETVGNSRSLHQSLVRSEGDESPGKNKNWRKKSSQVQSAWSNKGFDQQIVVSGNITQSAPAESNAPQNYKQRPPPNKTDSVSHPPNAISNSARGNRVTKVEGLIFSTQFKHEDDVSYTKILSRKNIDGASRERADTVKNDSLFHSEEQWPSLSITQSQNSSGNCVNVWIKNIDEKQSSCSKPGLTDVTSSSVSLQNIISGAKDNGTAYPNMNIVVNKPGCHSHVTDRKDLHEKNTQGYQSYDETTKERILNSELATKSYSKSKELEGNELKSCKKVTESPAYSKQMDVSSKMNSSHLSTVSMNQNTTNTELKTVIPSSSSMEEYTTEWQVQKKKKKKVKEQLETAVRNTDRNNSSNKEVKVKRDDSQNKYPKISKYDNTKKTNLGIGDKTLKNQSKSNRADKYDHGQEKLRESVQENADKGKDNFSKSKNFEEPSLLSHKSTRSNDRNVVAEVESSINSKSKDSVIVSGCALQNVPESSDGNSQRSSVSLATKEPPIKDEKAKKASAEKKARIKEEKMRRRELKIKKAQAQLLADSKVTVVSKEVLEMMYRGQNQRSGKMSGAVSKGKVFNPEPSQGGNENFQFSFENYPSLQGDSKNKVTKHKESPINDKGSVLQGPIMLGEGHYELKAKEDKDIKFQNSLTRRRVNVALSSFLSEDSKGKKADTSGASVSESTPSYSKALLTAASKEIGTKPSHEVNKPEVTQPTPKVNNSNLTRQTPEKKKVKTKDEIKFNLMDAVAKKVKKKDLLNVKKTKAVNQVDFDPVTMAIKERIRNRSRILLSALDHQTNKTDARERNQKRRRSLLAALDNTSKPRAEVVAKRGKQREGQKKKKLSALKKAIKRARQQEVENLLSVLQEAKKLQESSMPVDVPVTCSSPLETSETPVLDEAPEATTCDKEPENSTEKVENEDLKVVPGSDVQGVSLSNERASDCVKYENMANEINTKEIQSTNPDFSLKCQKILEDMEFLHNSVHKRSFREYCNHMITPEVNVAAKELISTLVAFQDRQYKRDPVKARMRRRFVCGLRSTVKAMGKMSCIVVAPDIERCKGPGALDEVVENMLRQAENHSVPVIFALTCKKIGNLCLKRVGVSCIGIINYHGAQGVFQKLMEMIPEAKAQYQQRVARGFCSIPVGDEPPDDEPESAQDSVKQVDSSDISKEATKDPSVVDRHSIREEVIASTVAILNEHSSEESVSFLENGKKLATNEEGSSLIMQFHGDREAEVVSSPAAPNKASDEELAY